MKQMHSAETDADKDAIHTQMKALHDATHKEIAALLTADELAKLEELMPKPSWRAKHGANDGATVLQ
jgi:NAD(P)H-nitrite reductase large subunit